MTKRRGDLRPAHRGYLFQDIATAYQLIRCITQSFDRVDVDKRQVIDDRFDDLQIIQGRQRSRRQFKASDNRVLALADFIKPSSNLYFEALAQLESGQLG
jgi:hypothetical protein